MKLLSEIGFSAVSVELFNVFFSLDRVVTERIVNTLLGTDFTVDEIEVNEVDKTAFGYYHPYLVLDSHCPRGRTAIILTVMPPERDYETHTLLSWMLSVTKLSRREVYPLILCLDTSKSFKRDEEQVSLRIINNDAFSFALSVVWMKMKSRKEGEKEDLISDLISTDRERIKDEEIKRLYALSYEISGVREMEDVAYSIWLDSLKLDIAKLGLDPEKIVKPHTNRS